MPTTTGQPDPSILTTQQSNAAVAALRDVIDTRLNAMDRAIVLLQETTDRHQSSSTMIAEYGEKFRSIFDRFTLTDRVFQEHFLKIDQQFYDQTSATALALSAADKAITNAFQAAEKAVAKADLAAEKGYLESQIKSLKEAFTQQIATQKDALEAALAASDKAVLKAETANEKRFESVNEFRATLSDQQRDLATKSEVGLRFTALEDRISAAVEDIREAKGRGLGTREVAVDNRAVISIVISLAAVAVLIILHFIK